MKNIISTIISINTILMKQRMPIDQRELFVLYGISIGNNTIAKLRTLARENITKPVYPTTIGLVTNSLEEKKLITKKKHITIRRNGSIPGKFTITTNGMILLKKIEADILANYFEK